MSLLQAVKRMDEVRCKLLLVIEAGRFIGLVSIGDIQRAIIRNVPLNERVGTVIRSDIVVCRVTDIESKVRAEMLRCRAAFMPLLDAGGGLVDVVFWEDIFPQQKARSKPRSLRLPVVIMAGGTGSRLRPLTNVLPKPLLPIGDRTIIETIMDQFEAVGCDTFSLALNYKANLLRYYFTDGDGKGRKVHFFEENKPLGTAGSLSLIKPHLQDTFFVSNCDIIVDQSIPEILDYHRENMNVLTVVAALKHLTIPYGTLETRNDGLLKSLNEKPELVFKVNTGVYILEPQVLESIPNDTFFNMTDLIELLIENGKRVGVFPVAEGSWTDVGNWTDYEQAIAKARHSI
jgi:dTDP-glucose pyrophosphorylase